MKEFYGEPGGRTAFNEDFEALRDLALSFHHIFDDCDENFVLWGCDVTKTVSASSVSFVISDGYVWLDGKIRKVNKSTITNVEAPFYIIPKDTSGTQINYAVKGTSGEMYYEYGTEVTTREPIETGFIMLGEGITKPTINNTLLNNYVLVKKNVEKQVINSKTSFLNEVFASNVILSNDNITASFEVTDNDSLKIFINQNELPVISYEISNGIKCYNSSGELIFDLSNGTDKQGGKDIFMPDVESDSIEYDTVNVPSNIDDLYINNEPFKNVYYPKTPFHDWTPFVWDDEAKTEIKSLMIKQIGYECFISGTLPINHSDFNAEQESYGTIGAIYKTNIRLPFAIQCPNGEANTLENMFFAVRGENITYRNISTIWYIKNGLLYYRVSPNYLYKRDGLLVPGIPCPSSIFWNFITD